MVTDLIGRERELEELVDRLEDHRLVTVVGPGGIGKTAIARAVAARQGPRFPLGAHFVDLTRVDDAEAVGGALAAQLGFPSFRALVDSPSDQPALLVVDNCEHVLDAAADAIDELLASCDAPAVVATSRSPLDLPGESLVVVGPLPLGSAEGADGAVRLFLERSRDAGADLTDHDRQSVADLCRALDGVPLAVEIAAARSRVLSPAEILDRLDDLDTLARPRFRGSERHRTVRATIEWSYEQLDGTEQAMFDRLGVPAAAFTAATAHAVAGEPGAPPSVTEGHLEGLVRVSLLVTEVADGATRYRQLHPVRTFARERLVARGEHDEICDRYVDHLVATGTALRRGGRGGWTADGLSELLALADHLLAGVRWAVGHDDQPDRAAALLSALWGVIHQGRTDDIGAAGELVLDRWPDGTGRRWALAMATVATCRHLQGRAQAAIELAERTVAGVEPGDRPPPTLFRVIGMAKAATGDLDGALAAFTEAEALAWQRGVDVLVREATICQAWVRAEQGATEVALAALRSVVDDAGAAGDGVNATWARMATGQVLLRSDPEAAAAVLTSTVDAARDLGYRAGLVGALQGLAQAALAVGNLPEAARRLVELIDEVTFGGAVTELRSLLRTAAAVLARAGDDHWADLAATATTLPRTSLLSRVGDDLFPLPDGRGRIRSVNEAMALARGRLEAVNAEPIPEPAADPAERAADEGTFRREGDLWRVAWAGREITVRPSKGVVDLSRLLAEPGREIHCLELAGAGAEQASTGEVIDDTARREYEQRIRDLQAEIDEAEANHDHARADRAQLEFDAVVEHLAGALGLGGRARRGGSTAERARSAVTHRIRATIRRLADEHPEVGRHLAVSVATGVYCSYRPERPVHWTT